MSAELYFGQYALWITGALASVERTRIRDAYLLMEKAKRIFVAGNGGSAAIANHLVTDFAKAGFGNVISLSSNQSLITMIANDYGYEKVFLKQLEYHGANSGDLTILISSSGNSKNIVSAAQYGITILGLTGFSGGELGPLSNVNIHVNSNNYGIIEDVHQTVMHVLAQWYLKSHGS